MLSFSPPLRKILMNNKKSIDPDLFLDSDVLAKIESETHSILLQLVDKPEFLDLVELRENPALKLLLFIIPFIERLVWQTKNSNPPLFHELARMEPLWQLLILCWIYHNRKKLNIPQTAEDLPITLQNALGFSRWEIQAFLIPQTDSRFICISAPFFTNGHHYDQYAFYVEQGIYFKFCFLAFFSLLANDCTDHPEAEELVAALLRRS